MHQPSVPTREYDAPDRPVSPSTSRRGRCAICTHPIWDTQEAHHVPQTLQRYATDYATFPRPYQHQGC